MKEINLLKAAEQSGFTGNAGINLDVVSVSKYPPTGSLSYEHNEQGDLVEIGKDKDGKPIYKPLNPITVRMNHYHRDVLDTLCNMSAAKRGQVIIQALLAMAETKGVI